MKRIALFFLGMAMAGLVAAQNPTMNPGPMGKALSIANVVNAQVVDEDAESLLVVTRKSGHLASRFSGKELMVMKLDKSLNIQQKLVMDNTEESELIGVNCQHGIVSILVSDKSKKATVLHRMIVDVEKMEVTKNDEVFRSSYEKKDDNQLFYITSPNGDYTAVVSVLVMHSGEYTCEVLMFDREMNFLWERQHPLDGMTDMFLTNEGDLHVISLTRGINESAIDFVMFNHQKKVTARAVVSEGLLSAAVANVIGEKVIVGGTLLSSESSRDNLLTGGVYGMSYDMGTQQMAGFSLGKFHHDDLVVLTDKKQSARVKKEYVRSLEIDRSVGTDFGGAFSYVGAFVIKEISSNGILKMHYNRLGMLATAVDTNGQILYKVPIRHNMLQDEFNALLNVPLISDGTNVMLINTEHPSTDKSYNIAKRTGLVKAMKSKANTALYTIALDGSVEKEVIPEKKATVVLGKSSTWRNGSYSLFRTTGSRTQLLQVRSSK